MEPVEIGNGVRAVGLVEQLELVPVPRRRRGVSIEPAHDLIDAALADAGMELAADATLRASTEESRVRRRGDEAQIAVPPTVEVDVGPGEDAVVLLERGDSVYNWVFPDEASEPARRRTRAAGPRTLTFRLAPEESERAQGRRGPIGAAINLLIEPVRVRVVRFAAGWAIGRAVEWIEGDLQEGLVDMSGPAEEWIASGDAVPRLPAGGTPKVLLFVHGTFSTTQGSFGALERTEAGRAFLEAARRRYDLVLGFDHRTLAADPDGNAADIAAALDFLPAGSEVDAIAYSRGGLVLRSLIELTRDRLRFERAVFVGCTNGGTHLAEPGNWRVLVDLYTSILVAGSKVLNLLASAPVSFGVEQTIRTIARFVQALPELAIEEGQVPGLAAMRPTSSIVGRLAAAAPLDPPFRAHVVASDYEPRIDPSRAITGELAEFLVDRVVDRLFDRSNDLVVDTGSMSAFGGFAPHPEGDDMLVMPAADSIYHVIYFASETVARRLTSWLTEEIASGAPTRGVPRMRESVDLPLAREDSFTARYINPFDMSGLPDVPDVGDLVNRSALPGIGGGGPEDARPRRQTRSAPPTHPAAAAPAPVPAAEPLAAEPVVPGGPAARGETVTRNCHFAAEMDSNPVVGTLVPLFVTISAEKIVVAEGMAAAATETPIQVDAGEPILMSVVALTNCEIVGDSRTIVEVPEKTASRRFTVRGFAPGAAQIQVEAHQSGRSLASFRLTPVFTVSDTGKLTASATATVGASGTRNAAVMRIYEQRAQDGTYVIRYDLYGPGLAETREVRLPADFSLQAFVGQFLERLEKAYELEGTQYDKFLSRVSDFAVDSTNQLVPPEVRRALWEHRDRIEAVQVISDSPYMPWELLYIDDPAGGGLTNAGFLCEWGLVRWMYNVPWPADTLQLRPERVRYVIPQYLNVRDRLPEADQERALLAARFPGAAEVDASSDVLARFLSEASGQCDLLHFACHGEAQQMAVLNSELVLRGDRTERGLVAQDLFSASTAKRRAIFATSREEPHGLVFINACQTGRSGEGISGVSGFADSFLRPASQKGAAAFVGALWSVDDHLARTFAETFYDDLLGGSTLVEAATRAREACKQKGDFTWLAYTIYGNPFARAA